MLPSNSSVSLHFPPSLSSLAQAGPPPPLTDPQNTIYLDTKKGQVIIQLRPDLAPKHVEQIKALIKKRLLRRHRLPSRHPGLHGADRRPDRHRHRRLGLPDLPAEFTQTPFMRGVVGMARSRIRIPPTASSSSCSTTARS